MRLKPIQTEEEYEVMLAWIDSQFNLGVPFESPEGESLQVALLLIKAYEDALGEEVEEVDYEQKAMLNRQLNLLRNDYEKVKTMQELTKDEL